MMSISDPIPASVEVQCPYCIRCQIVTVETHDVKERFLCEVCGQIFTACVSVDVGELPENQRKIQPVHFPSDPDYLFWYNEDKWAIDSSQGAMLREDCPLPSEWHDPLYPGWLRVDGQMAVDAREMLEGRRWLSTNGRTTYHRRFLPILGGEGITMGSGQRFYRDGQCIALIMPCIDGEIDAQGRPVGGGGR